MNKRKYIGLTYGDPAGIGPEILLKTLNNWKYKFTPMIIGHEKYLTQGNKKLNKFIFHPNSCIRNLNSQIVFGKPSKNSGQHAYDCLKESVLLAKSKKISALLTGPVSKEAINLANIKFSGQTDEIAKLCKINPENVIMLFCSGDFRITLFTRHIPLSSVKEKVKERQLKEFIVLLNKELKKWFSIKKPKIAILGLNPHASENGLFGDQENKIIIPAIKKLKSKGINVFGPLSADAALAHAGQNYLKGKKQKYDVYVSFYHDQALPVFKTVCGLNGVNVTLGLPFLRVSVDHGTAFDIAGKKKADNSSLVSAIKLLEKLL